MRDGVYRSSRGARRIDGRSSDMARARLKADGTVDRRGPKGAHDDAPRRSIRVRVDATTDKGDRSTDRLGCSGCRQGQRRPMRGGCGRGRGCRRPSSPGVSACRSTVARTGRRASVPRAVPPEPCSRSSTRRRNWRSRSSTAADIVDRRRRVGGGAPVIPRSDKTFTLHPSIAATRRNQS